MKIGGRIQEQRMKHGLSQDALAEKLGVTRQSVSKWELGQALPDIDKVVLLSRFFNITTDDLLLDEPSGIVKPGKQSFRWGLYLIVKDFDKSVRFYEKFLGSKAFVVGINRFVQFYFNDICMLSIMNEAHLYGHDYTGTGDNKFALNLWVKDLKQEYCRVKGLCIGPVTEIFHPNPHYYFFNLTDPDGNIIEVTGEYYEGDEWND